LIIRKHFEVYPLLTYKLVYFKLWCTVLDLMFNKDHLTIEGINKIVALKEHSYKGLNESLKLALPDYLNYLQPCPAYNPDFENLNIHWLCGFINADGHFKVEVSKDSKYKLGERCKPLIQITQKVPSLIVLQEIGTFLGLGTVILRTNQSDADFRIQNLKDVNTFIAKFNEAKLLGAKALDYLAFCKNIDLMNKGLHLTKEGLAQIQKTNSNVNTNRTIFKKNK